MIDDYYAEEYTILESTKTADGYSGKNITWSEVANSTFKGKKRLLRTNERISNNSAQYSEQWKIYCDVSVSVTRKNRLRTADGDYNIISAPENKWGHHLEIIIAII